MVLRIMVIFRFVFIIWIVAVQFHLSAHGEHLDIETPHHECLLCHELSDLDGDYNDYICVAPNIETIVNGSYIYDHSLANDRELYLGARSPPCYSHEVFI